MSNNIRALVSIIDLDATKELASGAEKLQYGTTMLLLGMGTIFTVLAIIWLSLVLFKFVFHDLAAKKKEAPIEEPVVAAPIVTAAPCDEEIVAVIAAAIAMAESEGNGIKFRVVSFRRI